MVLTPRVRFGCWVGFILLCVMPWLDLQDHAHWNRVLWVPFVSPPVRVVDVLVNTALYVPFGYWFLEASTRRRRTWQVLALAAALSAGTEWSQVYSHSRYPSMTDLTCNVVGAWYGARWAARSKAVKPSRMREA